jgi:hypothetical protein
MQAVLLAVIMIAKTERDGYEKKCIQGVSNRMALSEDDISILSGFLVTITKTFEPQGLADVASPFLWVTSGKSCRTKFIAEGYVRGIICGQDNL